MKNWIKITFDKVFFCALLVLLVLSVFTAFSEDNLLLYSPLPLFIPVLLIVFLIKHQYLSIPIILFLLFSFLGDVSSTFFVNETVMIDLMSIELSSIFYAISYLNLIIAALLKFKIFEVDRLIGVYLVVVFSINLYFLYTIFGILKVFIDVSDITMFGVNSLSLMILGFISFGVYLNTQTKPSISFLIAVICFVFSVILNYINQYYLYDWSFVMLNRAIYALGLYQIFKYVIKENENRRPVNSEEIERFSSDNVLV